MQIETYDWDCTRVSVTPNLNGDIDVIHTVHWICTGVSDTLKDDEPITVAVQGSETIQVDPDKTFLPFEDVTNEILTSWVKESIGPYKEQGIYNTLDRYISELDTPTSVNRELSS